MADVFLSYKRDERVGVELIASRLRVLGLTVWFDASLSAGEAFNAEIDREAREASAIVVCWSPAARTSKWINAEAMIGFEQDKLAACYIAGPDEFDPPAPFNISHAEDLRAWVTTPSDFHTGWRSLLRRVGRLCRRTDLESWGALDAQSSASELRSWIESHHNSPLFLTVSDALSRREKEDTERTRLEEEARKQRLKEQVAREAQEEIESKAREALTALAQEAERRAQGPIPTLVGSTLAIPVFLLAYAVVGSLTFVALMTVQWLAGSSRGEGLTYGSELIAALGSGYAGVVGGRAAIDGTIKAWSGWPTFLFLLCAWTAVLFTVLNRVPISGNLWLIILLIGHCLVSSASGFHFIARKRTAP